MSHNVTLTPRQRRAVPALLSTTTIADAAESAGVTRKTLSRWLNDDPVFSAALRQAQDRAIDQAVSRLAGEARAAVETLAEIHSDKDAPASVRVQAAQQVLAHVLRFMDQRELAGRVDDLEKLIDELQKQDSRP